MPWSGGAEAQGCFGRLTRRCRLCLGEGDGRQLGWRLQQLRHGEAPTPVVVGPAGSAHLEEQLLCRAGRTGAGQHTTQRCRVAAARLQPLRSLAQAEDMKDSSLAGQTTDVCVSTQPFKDGSAQRIPEELSC